jgi:hypothetical protein
MQHYNGTGEINGLEIQVSPVHHWILGQPTASKTLYRWEFRVQLRPKLGFL